MLGRGDVEFFFNQSPGVAGQVRLRAAVGYDACIHVTGLRELPVQLASREAKIVDGPADRIHGMRELVVEDCHGSRLALGEDPAPAA